MFWSSWVSVNWTTRNSPFLNFSGAGLTQPALAFDQTYEGKRADLQSV